MVEDISILKKVKQSGILAGNHVKLL